MIFLTVTTMKSNWKENKIERPGRQLSQTEKWIENSI